MQQNFDPEQISTKAQELKLMYFAEAVRHISTEQSASCFQIPVFGGMKAGKSTLIANLLECDQAFLPPGILEATAKNVRVQFGFAAARKVVDEVGNETLVETDEAWDSLIRGLEATPNPTDKLVLDLPNTELRDLNMVMIDTPGNNTLDNHKAIETLKALTDSQLGIYCLRATENMCGSDLAFIKAAADYLDNYIFVITRIDETGASSVSDASVAQQVEYTRKRLAELKIVPLAVVAVSSKIAEKSKSGLPELKQTIRDQIIRSGEALRIAYLKKQILKIARGKLQNVENELTLLDKNLSTEKEEFFRQISLLKAKLIDTSLEKKQAGRKLQISLEQKRLMLEKKISSSASAALASLKEKINGIDSARELEETAKLMLMTTLDTWRKEVKTLLEQFADSSDEMISEAASVFLHNIQNHIHNELHVDFKVNLANPEQYSVSEAMTGELDRLEQERQQLLQNIQQIQEEIQESNDSIPELTQTLAAAKEQLDSMHYEPVMEKKRFGTVSGGAKDILSTVGTVSDWLLLLTPIPMSKLKWLNKLKYGKAIGNIIKNTNKIIRVKNKWIGRTLKLIPGVEKVAETGWLQTFVSVFSVEHWASELGEIIDKANTQTMTVENEEVRQKFQEETAAYRQQIHDLQSELQLKTGILEKKSQQLREMERQNQSITMEYRQLEEEIQQVKEEMERQKGKEILYNGKKQLFAQAYNLLGDRNSAVMAPVFQKLEQAFTKAQTTLEPQLMRQIDDTIEALNRHIDDSEINYNVSKADLEDKQELLRRQYDFFAWLTAQEQTIND